jgi:hypothetical protein
MTTSLLYRKTMTNGTDAIIVTVLNDHRGLTAWLTVSGKATYPLTRANLMQLVGIGEQASAAWDKANRIKPMPTVEQLHALDNAVKAYEDGMTQEQAALRFGLNVNQVRTAMRKAGVKARPRKERYGKRGEQAA